MEHDRGNGKESRRRVSSIAIQLLVFYTSFSRFTKLI